MILPRFAHRTPLVRVICFILCYSLAFPFLNIISESGATSLSKAAPAEPTKTKTNRKATQTAQTARWREGELLVRFRRGAPVSKINALLRSNGAQWDGQLRGQSLVERLRLSAGADPESVAAALRTSTLVDFAEPNYLIAADQASPDDTRFSEQWAHHSTLSSRAWAVTTGSQKTVIAVLDSGVDFTHPDLVENKWVNSLEQANGRDEDGNDFADDLHGWDFIVNSGEIRDEQGHGTLVAGIIAAQGNNGIGITGVMWRAGLMSLRVLDNTGTGDVAAAVEAIDYATTNGAQVINCSWGTDNASVALLEAISRASTRGIVVVASAGNNSRDIEVTPRYPASYDLKNLISVGSTDRDDLLTSFSNHGTTRVSIAAPGTDILTTALGGGYQTISGTSASAPFVTGVVGLVKDLRSWLGADRTREMILRGARQVPTLSDKVASKGVLSAAGAVGALDTLLPNEGLDENKGNNGGGHGRERGNENNRGNRRGNNPSSNSGNRHNGLGESTVKPPAPTRGVPGNGLPNLDDLRGKQPTNPKAPDPIPSTRCSSHDSECARRKRAAIESSSDLLAWGLNLPPTGMLYGSHSRAISDSPFQLFWSPSASIAVSLPQPQATRTNVALSSNGGVASASSTTPDSEFPGYEFHPSSVNDGNRRGNTYPHNGFWRDATPDVYPDWIEVDFNGAKSIDEIDVFSLQDNIDYVQPVEPIETMTFTQGGITQFDVQYWNGSSWVTVSGGSVSGNSLIWRKFTFTSITTSKVRVLVNNALANRSRLVELEAWGTAALPRANVALAANGGVANASSYLSDPYWGTYLPVYVIDGSRRAVNGTLWLDNTYTSFPDWIEVTFSSSKTIDEIDVITQQDDYQNLIEPTLSQTFSLYGITSFDAQYWNGTSWVTITNGSVTGNNKVWRQFTFTPITTTKVRVLVNSVADNTFSRVVEVEAWGVAGSPSEPSDNNYSTARLDAINRTGQGGVDLLSRNANWSLPILGLRGRAGLDLGLSLSYNSLVWTRAQDGASIKFDADRGTPSPGFRLGFPVIQPSFHNPQTGRNAYLLISPSGGRAELRQVGSSNVYEAADSSYLQLIDDGGGDLTLRPTDGSTLTYKLKNGQYQCSRIKDRNGNYIDITYYDDGRLNTITDTLNRVIAFNYDAYLHLTSITQTQGGVTHTWATFGWGNVTVSTNFPGMTVAGPQNNTIIPVLTQVGYADGTRYNFEYNSYAQVAVIRHYAYDDHQLSYTSYTLPASGNDCPRVTEQKVWAEHWSGQNNVPAEVVTQYSTASDNSSGQAAIPDGTIYKELFATTGWQKGLTTGTEVWSGGVKKKWTTTAYTQDDTSLSYEKNPRVTETNIYDSDNNRKRTVIEYGPYAQWGLPYQVKEYAADATTEIRHSFTDYNLSTEYVSRRIIGLVSARHLSDTSTWQTIITYSYDDGGTQLVGTPTQTVQHDSSFGTNFVAGRGNLTRVTRYDVTDINNESKRIVTQLGYDTNGSVVFTRDPLSHETKLNYADSFSDGVNYNTFAYPTTVTDADNFSSTTQYSYILGAVTRTQGPPPAGHAQGAIQTFEYDSAGRIQRVNSLVNNVNYAYRRWFYAPAGHVSVYTTMQTGAQETYSTTVFDGLGRVRGTSADNPNSDGGYRGQFVQYDMMGRTLKQSNLTEIDHLWVPKGDDQAGWLWTEQQYDWKGRPTITTNPDGTTKEAIYGGCACAGGEVVTVSDEGTLIGGALTRRRKRFSSDILGRPLKTEVLNWDGSVYSTATKNYNARDQVVSIIEQSGTGGASQTTQLTYDGYGRLKTQQSPSQSAATQYAYNLDDTVAQVTDARGVVSTFSYNNRRLVTGISYSALPGIVGTSPVSFIYDAAGNRTHMSDGSGSVSYTYDQLSRLTSESRQFAGLTGTFTLSYDYNLANELTGIMDPTGKWVNYSYDKAGRMTEVTGTSFAGVTQYATNVRYRAWGAVKSASYGDSSSLSVSYNSRFLPTDFSVSGQIAKRYQYNSDGSLRYSQDILSGRFDRSYSYDHAGRVTEAFSGPLARGEADGNLRPYKLYYEYDALNHLTERSGRVWSGPHSANTGSGVYVNNRNTGWQYDADGRLTDSGDTAYSYDAAGRAINVVSDGGNVTQMPLYDGDGARTKLVTQKITYHEDGTITTETKTQYYVRSSVLNSVITELNDSGQKKRTFVYQGGQILAWQQQNGTTETIAWEHRDLSNASVRIPGSIDESGAAELEPMGTDAGTFNPFVTPPAVEGRESTYPAFAALTRDECRVDGLDMPCEIARATIQCPNNDCTPRAMRDSSGRAVGIVVFDSNAYLDNRGIGGYAGFIPAGATYTGDGRTVGARPSPDGGWPTGGATRQYDSYGHRTSPQNPVGLRGDQLKKYLESRKKAQNRLRKSKSSCADLLAKADITIGELISALDNQVPLSGPDSTSISALDAGIVGPIDNTLPSQSRRAAQQQANDSVSLFFEKNPNTKAITALFGVNSSHVYFKSKEWSSKQWTIVHEGLHSITRLGDLALAEKLGLGTFESNGLASDAITQALKDSGCVK